MTESDSSTRQGIRVPEIVTASLPNSLMVVSRSRGSPRHPCSSVCGSDCTCLPARSTVASTFSVTPSSFTPESVVRVRATLVLISFPCRSKVSVIRLTFFQLPGRNRPQG